MAKLFVVRRCDTFYRYWHDITEPSPLAEAHAAYDRLTEGGLHNTTPDAPEYYDIFQTASLPGWSEGPPLVRRLHHHDATAIEAHLLSLSGNDRRLRFFREMTDRQILAYVRDIDWGRSLLLGAIRADRVIGMAEALFGHGAPSRRAEIAVSVHRDFRERGLGGHLVSQTVDRAALMGARDAYLIFLRENRPLRRIVDALGGLVGREDSVSADGLIGEIRTDLFDGAPAFAGSMTSI